MKKIEKLGWILIALVFLLMATSCSKDDPCDCVKEFYEVEWVVVFENGLPKNKRVERYLRSENIGCQDEYNLQLEESPNIYSKINCTY